MPRLLAALLTVSLLGNAALLLVLHHQAALPAAAIAMDGRQQPPGGALGSSSPDALAPGSPDEAASAELVALFKRMDPARLHALLLAAGVDADVRTQFVQAMLWKKYEARLQALDPDRDPAAATAWWKDSGGRGRSDSPEERQRAVAYNRLNEEIAAECQRIVGINPDAFEPEKQPWLARQYGGLPREKAEALYRIGRDYDELQNELQREIGSFELPQDQEKLRLIATERERDIAALLTPEERTDWELRNSDTANQLRYRMTQLDATEDEYRRIYALQKAFDAEFETSEDGHLFSSPADRDLEFWQRREAAQTALETQIRAIVGETRYTTAALETDSDFTTARAAAERLGLPADTAPRLIALRAPAATESRRIAADPALDLSQKKAALARLAADTRTQVVQTLGPAAAEAYFKRGAMNWLERLEQGQTIALKPGGGYETLDLESEPAP